MLQILLRGSAPFAGWTGRAIGIARQADERSQFHQGLVPAAGMVAVKQGVGFGLDLDIGRSGEARDDSANIAVDGGVGRSESDAGDAAAV